MPKTKHTLMVYRTFKFMVTLIEDQSSGKLSTQSKVTIATAIFGIAILFFGIAYGVSYFSATSIKNVKKERDEILSEMIRVNMGEIPRSPSEVRLKLVTELDEIKGNGDSVNALIDKYKKPQIENINEISKKIEQNPTVDIHSFINKEKVIVDAEILEIDKKIEAITQEIVKIDTDNSALQTVTDEFKDQLYGKKIKDLIENFDKANENKITVNKFKEDYEKYLKLPNDSGDSNINNPTSSRNLIDFILQYDESLTPVGNLGEVQISYTSLINHLQTELKKHIKLYDDNIAKKSSNINKLQTLTKDRDLKIKNNVSLETYKKNKAYIFHNQYKISKLSIDYCIEKAIKFYAFHKAIVYSLLVFTTIISLCAFVISKQGWTQTPKIIQIVSVCVLVIIGMFNLMSAVLKPKENYDTYIAKAELNEKVQSDIVLFFNKYDKLNEADVDTLILENFSKITKFSEILPSTDEKGISEDKFGFADIIGDK